jgi:hypothetical protein
MNSRLIAKPQKQLDFGLGKRSGLDGSAAEKTMLKSVTAAGPELSPTAFPHPAGVTDKTQGWSNWSHTAGFDGVPN